MAYKFSVTLTSAGNNQITFTNGSKTVTGVGSQFLSELAVGVMVKLNADPASDYAAVASIASNTSLQLATNYAGSSATGAASKSTLNVTVSTFALAMYQLKTVLVSAGWTVTKSGDGLSAFGAASDIITSGLAGANGLDNGKAWFVIQQPGAIPRQFCIQRQTTTGASTSMYWRIKYSKAAGFTGGSPSATVTPSATDEVVLIGTGTDASPTFPNYVCFANDNQFRFNCFADDASPYGFHSWSWIMSTAQTSHGFGLEPLTAAAPEDPDPAVVVLSSSNTVNVPWTNAFFRETTTASGGGAWIGSTFFKFSSSVPALGLVGPSSNSFPSLDFWGLSYDNPFNGKDDLFPITAIAEFQSAQAPYHYYKGICSILRGCAQATGRISGQLYSITTSRDGVLVGHTVLPWDGASTPLV
jgi:hypothetical protein